jgi:hypothetical protein
MIVAACTSNDNHVTDEPLTRPPGTLLPDGFRVAENTRLIGTVFRPPQGGWEALLLVERDPVGVYDTYAEQARALQVPLPGSGAPPEDPRQPVDVPCHDVTKSVPVPGSGHVIPGTWRPVGSADSADAEVIECAWSASNARFTLEIDLRWGGENRHVLLTVTPDGGGGNRPVRGTERVTGIALPPITPRPVAATPGTPFGARNNAFERGYARFTLAEGSRLAAPEGYVLGFWDFVAVLRLDGDAEKVMRSYAQQLGRGGATPPVRRVSTLSGKVLVVENVVEAGGGGATLFTDPTRTWLLVQTHSD